MKNIKQFLSNKLKSLHLSILKRDSEYIKNLFLLEDLNSAINNINHGLKSLNDFPEEKEKIQKFVFDLRSKINIVSNTLKKLNEEIHDKIKKANQDFLKNFTVPSGLFSNFTLLYNESTSSYQVITSKKYLESTKKLKAYRTDLISDLSVFIAREIDFYLPNEYKNLCKYKLFTDFTLIIDENYFTKISSKNFSPEYEKEFIEAVNSFYIKNKKSRSIKFKNSKVLSKYHGHFADASIIS